MCNQILFTTSLCGHTLPPMIDTTCYLSLRSSCPNLTTTPSLIPDALCPSCHPINALPYTFYKHEFYSALCGHSFGHADSDLLRLPSEPDIVLVTPTEDDTCGEERCKNRAEGEAVGKSKMPAEYEGLVRVFTKMPELESRYLGDDGRPKTGTWGGSGRSRHVPASTSHRPASGLADSSSITMKDGRAFRDMSEFDSKTVHPDDEATNFPTAHFNSEAAQPLTLEEEEERINNFPSKWADPKYFPPSPKGPHHQHKHKPEDSVETYASNNTVVENKKGPSSSAFSTSRYSTAHSRLPDASRRPSSLQAPGRNGNAPRAPNRKSEHDPQSHTSQKTPGQSNAKPPLVLRRSSRPSQPDPETGYLQRPNKESKARGEGSMELDK